MLFLKKIFNYYILQNWWNVGMLFIILSCQQKNIFLLEICDFEQRFPCHFFPPEAPESYVCWIEEKKKKTFSVIIFITPVDSEVVGTDHLDAGAAVQLIGTIHCDTGRIKIEEGQTRQLQGLNTYATHKQTNYIQQHLSMIV